MRAIVLKQLLRRSAPPTLLAVSMVGAGWMGIHSAYYVDQQDAKGMAILTQEITARLAVELGPNAQLCDEITIGLAFEKAAQNTVKVTGASFIKMSDDTFPQLIYTDRDGQPRAATPNGVERVVGRILNLAPGDYTQLPPMEVIALGGERARLKPENNANNLRPNAFGERATLSRDHRFREILNVVRACSEQVMGILGERQVRTNARFAWPGWGRSYVVQFTRPLSNTSNSEAVAEVVPHPL